jgi:SAM-dependent methyltransferase
MYADIAGIYDKMNRDVDYGKIADHIEKLFGKNAVKPESVADLGCGTGDLCIEMRRRGYDMTGIDLSAEMLSQAADKSRESGFDDILYLNQDIAAFELFGTVDAIICVQDVLNHVLSVSKLKRVFRLAHNYLNYGGVFIFDLNTLENMRDRLGGNTFHHIENDFAYIWRNKYDPVKMLNKFDMTYFVLDPQSGKYDRLDEILTEKAYLPEEVGEALTDAGLKITGIYGGHTLHAPKPSEKRVFYTAVKIRP